MWLKLVCGILAVLVGQWLFQRIYLMGYHKHVYNHRPGPCRLIEGVEHGAEDIQVLPSGLAIMTTGLHFISHDAALKVPGGMGLFDFKANSKSIQPLHVDKKIGEFNPHGLSLWVDKKQNKVYVFVVNHQQTIDTVEVFQFEEKARKLKHVRTIQDRSFSYLNDLVATGPDSFYFTNFMKYRSTFEILFLLSWANIGYFNGKNSTYVASGLSLPNGINLSPDGKFVYVAHSGKNELQIYKRQANNELQLSKEIPLYSFIDNIDIDVDSGDIWLGNHVTLHRIVAYGANHSEPSPSQVLRVKVNKGDVIDVQEVFVDDGRFFSASSVAVKYGKQMLVGSVSTKLMLCDLRTLQ